LRGRFFFGFDDFSLATQLDGAGTGAGGGGKGFGFRGLCLCLIGQRPHLRGCVRCVVAVHRNQFRVSSILAAAAAHRSPARERGCS
jgi:hypothetical protein